MSKSNIDIGINIIRNAVLDSLYLKISTLNLDDDVLTRLNEALDEEKSNDTVIPKKKKQINFNHPKREIAPENQCTRTMKNGEKCKGIKTNDITQSCWGHMTAAEKEEHRLNKGKTPVGKKKYVAQRKAEDAVNE
jgi:hypothetical protein